MDKKTGFVSLQSLKGAPAPESALEQIRRIYFRTTRDTIEHDMAHAIELLKSLPDEETREKATVYMEGLAQMRSEWGRRKKAAGAAKSPTGKRKHKGGRRGPG